MSIRSSGPFGFSDSKNRFQLGGRTRFLQIRYNVTYPKFRHITNCCKGDTAAFSDRRRNAAAGKKGSLTSIRTCIQKNLLITEAVYLSMYSW